MVEGPPKSVLNNLFLQVILAPMDRVRNCSLAVRIFLVCSCQTEGLRSQQPISVFLYFFCLLLKLNTVLQIQTFLDVIATVVLMTNSSLFLTDLTVNTTSRTGSWTSQCSAWHNSCWAGMPWYQPCISVSGSFHGRDTCMEKPVGWTWLVVSC